MNRRAARPESAATVLASVAMRVLYPALFFPLLVLAALSGCDKDPCGPFGCTEETPTPAALDDLCLQDGQTRCVGDVFELCQAGEWVQGATCGSPTPVCDATLGCLPCTPNSTFCTGNVVNECIADGTDSQPVQTCADGFECYAGQCFDACEVAAQQYSYEGCEFMAVTTANHLLDGAFDEDFAVVIGNADPEQSAQIRVRRNGVTQSSHTIPPGETTAVHLGVVPELKAAGGDVVVHGGAFEVESNIPVVAYQYNPLDYQLAQTHSYTNDASLLLPSRAFGLEYLVSTMPTLGVDLGSGYEWQPGFVTVVATENDTQVTVVSSTYTTGGADILPMEPGSEQTIQLSRGEVMQIFSRHSGDTCAQVGGVQRQVQAGMDTWGVCLDKDADLTGTEIRANRPVGVFSGHDCTFVPFDKSACDHLEESLIPVQTWGQTVPVSAPSHPNGSSLAPTTIRVISGADDNTIHFIPDIQSDVVLNKGEWIEFDSEGHFLVEATDRVLVSQFLWGEDAIDAVRGDPAMTHLVSANQWRSRYDILAPTSFPFNGVNITTTRDAIVYLDDEELDGDWEEITGTDYVVQRVVLTSGSHRLESVGGVPFALSSYGYAQYTSYFYPGGLNLIR